ncbi:potassium uptake protein, integral membrane component, ktrb [hydrocarbon metagenome]|uniref:Potassium uptake protein, integral membrane component, ktrb n=1 Tax=hydrocarbon metagenome TaxID=938273 RepID=A0A0W8E3U3_9ZZZZ
MIERLNPAQILVAGFFIVIMGGSLLLSTPWAVQEGEVNYLTALFTAASAVCVTGLVVVDTATHWNPFGQFIIMLPFQIGGLGIMSFATFFALILGNNIQLKQRLAMQQAINRSSMEGIVGIFKYLLILSFVIELIGAVILFIYWLPYMDTGRAVWYSIFHSISAFNNAGFDLFGNFSSLTAFTGNAVVSFTISFLFIAGSLGFIVVYEIFNYRKNRSLSLHSRVVLITTLMVLIGGALLFFILEYHHTLQGLTMNEKFITSFFQSSSRTSGFTTVDLSGSVLPTQMLLMFLMFIGGAPGSTAGGIKVTTLAILILALFSFLKGKRDAEVMERRIALEDLLKAAAIFFLSFGLVFVFAFLLSIGHAEPFNVILFEVISAVGTVGLSLGMTPELNSFGRLLIIVAMFLGRVGPITIAYSIVYSKKKGEIRYAEDRIMVG